MVSKWYHLEVRLCIWGHPQQQQRVSKWFELQPVFSSYSPYPGNFSDFQRTHGTGLVAPFSSPFSPSTNHCKSFTGMFSALRAFQTTIFSFLVRLNTSSENPKLQKFQRTGLSCSDIKSNRTFTGKLLWIEASATIKKKNWAFLVLPNRYQWHGVLRASVKRLRPEALPFIWKSQTG